MIDKKELKKKINASLKPFAKENGFIKIGSRQYARVSNGILHVIIVEYASYGFTCRVAIQPLYIVCDVINLGFGYSIKRFDKKSKQRWSYETDENIDDIVSTIIRLLENVALKWFKEVKDPEGMIKSIEGMRVKNPKHMMSFHPLHKKRYLGYSYAYVGEYEKSKRMLYSLIDYLDGDTRHCINEMRYEANQLIDAIDESEESVKLLLEQNIEKTKELLKVN